MKQVELPVFPLKFVHFGKKAQHFQLYSGCHRADYRLEEEFLQQINKETLWIISTLCFFIEKKQCHTVIQKYPSVVLLLVSVGFECKTRYANKDNSSQRLPSIVMLNWRMPNYIIHRWNRYIIRKWNTTEFAAV